MTLDEIWTIRGDLRYVAFRVGTVKYVSLAHKDSEAAFDNADTKQSLTAEDRAADDWLIGEIAGVTAGGQVEAIEAR